MDETLFRAINNGLTTPALDWLAVTFSAKGYVVIVGTALATAAFVLGTRRVRMCAVAVVLSVVLTDLSSARVLKEWFAAPRPSAALDDVRLYRDGEWVMTGRWALYADASTSYGFPSNHAGNAAAFAAALGFIHPATLIVTVPSTVAVGWSRVYSGHHLPVDVFGGWLWGTACAVSVVLMLRAAARRWYPISENERMRDRWTAMPIERRMFVGLMVIWAAINFAFIHFNWYGLSADEAHYWEWSRQLDWSYYSKPPLIAYIIAILTGAAGDQEWVIRSGAVGLSVITLCCVYGLACRITKSDRTALLAAGLLMALPMTWAGSVLMTPDAPLACAWAAALYLFHRAVNGQSRAWWGVGIAIGLGLLAKYTMAYLAVSLLLYLVLADRRHLKTSGPYIAAIIAAVCMSGVIYWNAANDWISFRHTAAIGLADTLHPNVALNQFGEFAAGQLAAASPFIFVLVAWGTLRCLPHARRDRDAALLILSAGVIFAGYAITALFRSPEANWPACAYIAGCVAAAWSLHNIGPSAARRAFVVAAILIGVSMGIGIRSTGLLYAMGSEGERVDRLYLAGFTIDPNNDPTNELVGGHDLGRMVSSIIEQWPRGTPFVFSDRYQVASLAAYYSVGQPTAYCINVGKRRMNQYDLWGGWDELEGRDAIFVTGGGDVKAQAFVRYMLENRYFYDGRVFGSVNVKRGNTIIKTYTVSALSQYSGKAWPAAEGY